MSVNGSMQQLGQGMASLIAGVIVKTDKASHQLSNYNWVGYLSIAILVVSLLIGNKIFKAIDTPSNIDSEDDQPLKPNKLVLDIAE